MKVLVIEDNSRLASLIEKLLEDEGHVCKAVGTKEAALAAAAITHYDVILLDLSLPDGDGRDFLTVIRSTECSSLVLAVTARGDVVDRVQTLNSGADDYIVKPFSDDELIARVRALGRRLRPLRETVLSFGNVCLDIESWTLKVADRLVVCPRRELTVLSALLVHSGRVLPRNKLEMEIYATDSVVTDNAVEASISRLRRRLEESKANVSIIAMRGIGYILTETSAC